MVTANDSCVKPIVNVDELFIKTIKTRFIFMANISVDDVIQIQDVGMTTRIDWIGHSFEPGTRYYATVRAVNLIGLQTEVISDGFVFDDSPPVVGVVYNTGHHNDVICQSAFDPV